MMMVVDFSKRIGITVWTDEIKQWSTVEIEFSYDNNGECLSSIDFDIQFATNHQGIVDLSKVFEEYCKANAYDNVKILSANLIESEDTREALEEIRKEKNTLEKSQMD